MYSYGQRSHRRQYFERRGRVRPASPPEASSAATSPICCSNMAEIGEKEKMGDTDEKAATCQTRRDGECTSDWQMSLVKIGSTWDARWGRLEVLPSLLQRRGCLFGVGSASRRHHRQRRDFVIITTTNYLRPSSRHFNLYIPYRLTRSHGPDPTTLVALVGLPIATR